MFELLPQAKKPPCYSSGERESPVPAGLCTTKRQRLDIGDSSLLFVIPSVWASRECQSLIEKLLPSFLIDLFLEDPNMCSEVSQRLTIMTLCLDSPSSLTNKALLLGQAPYAWLFLSWDGILFKKSLPSPDRLPSGCPTGSSDLPSCGCPPGYMMWISFWKALQAWETSRRLPSGLQACLNVLKLPAMNSRL